MCEKRVNHKATGRIYTLMQSVIKTPKNCSDVALLTGDVMTSQSGTLPTVNTSTVNPVTSPALNYYRLARITLVEGTNQVRRTVLDHIPNGETLHTALAKNRKKFSDLYEKRIITEKQWRTLYPENALTDISHIDLTLWIFLLRNITKCRFRNVNWKEAPGPDQTEWYHDILRIKEIRNSLSHLPVPELDDESFEKLWNNITSALGRLDR
jgi:DZIP3/ hRUL138-like HEPN